MGQVSRSRICEYIRDQLENHCESMSKQDVFLCGKPDYRNEGHTPWPVTGNSAVAQKKTGNEK